jgi:hypothetical protein
MTGIYMHLKLPKELNFGLHKSTATSLYMTLELSQYNEFYGTRSSSVVRSYSATREIPYQVHRRVHRSAVGPYIQTVDRHKGKGKVIPVRAVEALRVARG